MPNSGTEFAYKYWRHVKAIAIGISVATCIVLLDPYLPRNTSTETITRTHRALRNSGDFISSHVDYYAITPHKIWNIPENLYFQLERGDELQIETTLLFRSVVRFSVVGKPATSARLYFPVYSPYSLNRMLLWLILTLALTGIFSRSILPSYMLISLSFFIALILFSAVQFSRFVARFVA